MNSNRRLPWWFTLLILVSLFIPAAVADEVRIYSEDATPVDATFYTWGPGVGVQEVQACDTPEGVRSQKTTAYSWGGWGVRYNAWKDLSEFQGGSIRFFVRTPVNLKVEFTCSGDVHHARYIGNYGWNGQNAWQEITIPVCDFFLPGSCDPTCLRQIEYAFSVTSESSATFSLDFARWYKTPTRPGRSTVQVLGRQLYVDGRPFAVKGVDYAPTPPCLDYRYDWSAHPERYLVDFPLMHDLGINAIRAYHVPTRGSALDAARTYGLYVIPQLTVDALKLTCEAGKAFLKTELNSLVTEWKDHPAILMWLAGNEVNGQLAWSDLTGWYALLDQMAANAHTLETEAGKPPYHPVTTANSDYWAMADVCAPGMSDDITLPHLDLWSLQMYRDCAFGASHGNDAFAQYRSKQNCARPVLMSEFGSDAWNSLLNREDPVMQDACIGSLLAKLQSERAVSLPGNVGVGGLIFEWQDEWWKSTCAAGLYCQQDTCTDWTNPGYETDPGMNEEWWGLCRNAIDPSARTCRQAIATVGKNWRLGEASGTGTACASTAMIVTAYDKLTSTVSVAYRPAPGATNHTVHYGSLSQVGSYGYFGMVCGLGAMGTASFSLPQGSFYWIMVGNDGREEGCYGKASSGTERPRDPNPDSCAMPQSPSRQCGCP